MTTPQTGSQGLALKVPPLLLAGIFALLMWLAHRATPGLSMPFPGHTIVGVLLAIAGLTFVLAAGYAFRAAGTTFDPTRPQKASALVTSGVYALSRNPMYVGFVLALGGWAAWLSNLAAAALIPLFIIYMNRFQIVPEESAMLEKFGETYGAYQASVRRWI